MGRPHYELEIYSPECGAKASGIYARMNELKEALRRGELNAQLKRSCSERPCSKDLPGRRPSIAESGVFRLFGRHRG